MPRTFGVEYPKVSKEASLIHHCSKIPQGASSTILADAPPHRTNIDDPPDKQIEHYVRITDANSKDVPQT